MDPPGKRKGLTTKLSVVSDCVVSVDLDMCGIAQRLLWSVKQQWRKQTFDKSTAGLAARAVRHVDLQISEANLDCRGHRDCCMDASPPLM
jgi:hypothetical protein